jgi:hypothetical protein
LDDISRKLYWIKAEHVNAIFSCDTCQCGCRFEGEAEEKGDYRTNKDIDTIEWEQKVGSRARGEKP